MVPKFPSIVVSMADEQEYPLHECIFSGDLRRLSALLRSHDIAQKDKHGN